VSLGHLRQKAEPAVTGQVGASSAWSGVQRPMSISFRARSEIGLAHLWVYVKEHGPPRVPRFHTCLHGYRLGAWVHVRRQAQGRDVRLDRLLESLSGWRWAPFEQRFDEAGYLAGDQELRRCAEHRTGARSRSLRRTGLNGCERRVFRSTRRG
jgi:hypothetical protein